MVTEVTVAMTVVMAEAMRVMAGWEWRIHLADSKAGRNKDARTRRTQSSVVLPVKKDLEPLTDLQHTGGENTHCQWHLIITQPHNVSHLVPTTMSFLWNVHKL